MYAEVDTRRPGAESDDDTFMALTHAGGVRSHLFASATAGHLAPRFRVLGADAAYVVEGLDEQEDALRAGQRPGPGWGEVPKNTGGGGMRATPVARFAPCLGGGRSSTRGWPPRSGARARRRSTRGTRSPQPWCWRRRRSQPGSAPWLRSDAPDADDPATERECESVDDRDRCRRSGSRVDEPPLPRVAVPDVDHALPGACGVLAPDRDGLATLFLALAARIGKGRAVVLQQVAQVPSADTVAATGSHVMPNPGIDWVARTYSRSAAFPIIGGWSGARTSPSSVQ